MTRISALQQQTTLTLPDNSESRVRKGTRQAHNSLPRGGLIVLASARNEVRSLDAAGNTVNA